MVAEGDSSLLDMPGLAHHVEEAERNSALEPPTASSLAVPHDQPLRVSRG